MRSRGSRMLEEVEPQKSLQRVRGGCLESQLTLKAAIETYKIRVAVAVPPFKKRKRVLTKHCVKYTDCWQQDASSRSHRPSAALHARRWLPSRYARHRNRHLHHHHHRHMGQRAELEASQSQHKHIKTSTTFILQQTATTTSSSASSTLFLGHSRLFNSTMHRGIWAAR